MVEDLKCTLKVIAAFNPDRNPHEIAREMLSPEGSTFIKPCTISIETTAHAKKPERKRAILRLTVENLISQNPKKGL